MQFFSRQRIVAKESSDFTPAGGIQVTRAQLENIINMILMILDDCKDLEEAKEKVAGIVKKEQQKDSGR